MSTAWLELASVMYDAHNALVVSFIGSANDGVAPKNVVLNHITQTNLFKNLSSRSGTDPEFLEQLKMFTTAPIEIGLDRERNIVYLLPASPLDTVSLEIACAQLSEEHLRSPESLHSRIESMEDEHTKAMLFCFMMSQVVCIMSPTMRLDLKWLQTLRKLEQLRQRFGDHNPTDSTILHPPNCMPALFFIFESDSAMEAHAISTARETLEAQIKRVFKSLLLSPSLERKKRLFYLPSSDFVFFYNPPSEPAARSPGEPIHVLLETFFAPPLSYFPETSSLRSGAPRHPQRSADPPKPAPSAQKDSTPVPSFLDALDARKASALARAQKVRDEEFQMECNVVMCDPTAWAAAASSLWTAMRMYSGEKEASSRLNTALPGATDVLKHFSLSRCQAAFPQALDHYTQDLPQYYPESTHRKHLAAADKVFTSLACGPMFRAERDRLIHECETVWASGRKSCEARSVTGRVCCKPRHGPKDVDGNKHSTNVQLMCSCVCGSIQKGVADPFGLEDLNVFHVEAECCARSIISSVSRALSSGETRGSSEGKSGLFETDSSLSSLLQRTPTLEGAQYSEGPSASLGTDPIPCWKLYFMGHGKTYSSSSGLSGKAGFLPRTSFLLPWEISVPDDWQGRGRGSLSRIWSADKQGQDDSGARDAKKHQLTSRGYIGYEYECPNGHRFIAGSAGKPVKLASSGLVKGTAYKVLNTSMPFAQPCPCSDNAMSQLTKLHIATPPSPFTFELLPRLQFCESPSVVVHSGIPFVLEPDCSYVLRLPRVFTQDGKPILLPTTPSALKQVVLLEHPITIREM